MVVCFIFVRLQFKAKELEEALEKLKSQMEEASESIDLKNDFRQPTKQVKVQAEEAATLAASNKVVVEDRERAAKISLRPFCKLWQRQKHVEGVFFSACHFQSGCSSSACETGRSKT